MVYDPAVLVEGDNCRADFRRTRAVRESMLYIRSRDIEMDSPRVLTALRRQVAGCGRISLRLENEGLAAGVWLCNCQIRDPDHSLLVCRCRPRARGSIVIVATAIAEPVLPSVKRQTHIVPTSVPAKIVGRVSECVKVVTVTNCAGCGRHDVVEVVEGFAAGFFCERRLPKMLARKS